MFLSPFANDRGDISVDTVRRDMWIERRIGSCMRRVLQNHEPHDYYFWLRTILQVYQTLLDSAHGKLAYRNVEAEYPPR